MLLIFTRSESWASAAEVVGFLFCMWAARVGRRTRPAALVWVLGLVALMAYWPPEGVPHGKAVLTGGEMMVRAGGVPREVRSEGSRAAADWSYRTGEQVFRLAFALYDYLDRFATHAYR